MSRQALQHNIKALVPNRWLHYFWPFLFCLIPFATDIIYRPQVHILVYFMLVYFFACFSGSRLLDVLAKPVALLLPALRDTLPWVILASAALYSLLSTVPILIYGPESVLSGPWISFVGLLLLGMALFQTVVLLCFRLTSSSLLFVLLICLFVFAGNSSLLQMRLRTIELLVSGVEGSVVMPLIFFIASTAATFVLTRRADFRRNLSGKTVMLFTDMVSPAMAKRAEVRKKQEKLRRESYHMDQPQRWQPAGKRIAGLKNPELAGFLDELNLYFLRTNWKIAVLKFVLVLVVIIIFFSIVFGLVNPKHMLILPLLAVAGQVHTFFWNRSSPMLPIGRERLFRIYLYKCALLWLGTVLLILALLLGVRLLHLSLPAPADALVGPFAALPLKASFYFALATPVLAWIFIFIRGFASYFILGILSVVVFAEGTLLFFDEFLQLNPIFVVLLTLLLSVPFVLQCRHYCYQSDLIRGSPGFVSG